MVGQEAFALNYLHVVDTIVLQHGPGNIGTGITRAEGNLAIVLKLGFQARANQHTQKAEYGHNYNVHHS